MARPDIGKCVSTGFDIFKKNALTYVVAWLILGIVNGMTFGIMLGPLLVGFFRMVKIDLGGGKAQIGDLFKGFEDLSAGIVAGIICVVAISIGSMLCVVPGLVAAPLLPVSLYLVSEGEKDGVKAVTRAWSAMSANIVESVVYMLLLGLLVFAGLMLCCVGLLVTAPLGFICQYVLAKQLTDDGAVV